MEPQLDSLVTGYPGSSDEAVLGTPGTSVCFRRRSSFAWPLRRRYARSYKVCTSTVTATSSRVRAAPNGSDPARTGLAGNGRWDRHFTQPVGSANRCPDSSFLGRGLTEVMKEHCLAERRSP